MTYFIKIPHSLIQIIFSFLKISDILIVRCLCKYFCFGSYNKLFWKEQFEFLDIINKSQKIKKFKLDEKNLFVIQIECKGNLSSMDHIFKNMHLNFPNLIYLNLRECYDFPIYTLDHLSKIKRLMFLDIYETSLAADLTVDKVKKMLNQLPNLIEIDFACQCGLTFPVTIDGIKVDFMWNEYEDILKNKKTVECLRHKHPNFNFFRTCKQNINGREFPHIKSWDKCRFSLDKIKDYKILFMTERYFK